MGRKEGTYDHGTLYKPQIFQITNKNIVGKNRIQFKFRKDSLSADGILTGFSSAC